MAHQGLQHGLTGGKMNPFASRSLSAIAGPEALSSYEMAHAMGSRMQGMHTDQQQALMREATYAGELNNLDKAPMLQPLHQAMSHELSGTAPQLQSKGFFPKEKVDELHDAGRVGESRLKRVANWLHPTNLYTKAVSGMGRVANKPFDTTTQRVAKSVVGAAPMAALGAADPIGSAAHMGINTTREVAANSAWGKREVGKLVSKGLEGKSELMGHALSPRGEKLVDHFVSPALLDPQRLGKHLNANGQADQVRRGISAVQTGGAAAEQARQGAGMLGHAIGQLNDALPQHAANAQAALARGAAKYFPNTAKEHLATHGTMPFVPQGALPPMPSHNGIRVRSNDPVHQEARNWARTKGEEFRQRRRDLDSFGLE